MSFDVLPLGDLLSEKGYIRGPFGSALKRQELKQSGIPVYEQQQAIDGHRRFRFFVDQEKYEQLRRFTVKANDLIISCSGTVGRVSVIAEGDPIGIISQALLILRPDVERLLPRFLYYFLTSPAGQASLLAASHGAVQQNIAPRAVVEKILTPMPRIEEQKAIISVLGSLDDRITLLRETNTTLEASAQALFKSWFVDFDPVRAKMAGRAPEGMDEATAALFPDALEESELGLVPKGWRVAKFEDFVLRISVGKKFDQKSAKSEGRVPILDQGKSGVIGYHDEDPGVRASLDQPVVVFANHTCYMRLICYDFSTIQNVLPFRGKGIDTVWAYYATKGRVKFSEYKGHWPDFAIEKTVVPNESLSVAFRFVVDPVMRRMRANELQIDSLSDLRDTLMPRLISGQLRMPDNECESATN